HNPEPSLFLVQVHALSVGILEKRCAVSQSSSGRFALEALEPRLLLSGGATSLLSACPERGGGEGDFLAKTGTAARLATNLTDLSYSPELEGDFGLVS